MKNLFTSKNNDMPVGYAVLALTIIISLATLFAWGQIQNDKTPNGHYNQVHMVNHIN